MKMTKKKEKKKENMVIRKYNPVAYARHLKQFIGSKYGNNNNKNMWIGISVYMASMQGM